MQLNEVMAVGLVGTLALAVGCADDERPVCTQEARTSVRVNVVDAKGATVNDASVSYAVDGGAPTPCAEVPYYACGSEEVGDFVITASRGTETGTAQVTVIRDGCHPITESVDLVIRSQ